MFKKAFALVLLAAALVATPVSTNFINPIPECVPCDDFAR